MKPLPQYLRGIAAVLVVLYHANLKLGNVYHVDVLPWFSGGGALAFIGVNIFFALSGYLMSSQVQTASPARFAWHRIARIYPAFYIAVGVMIGLSFIFNEGMPPIFWPSLTLFPTSGHGPLQVEWSLTFEMTFYVMSVVFCFEATRRYHFAFLCIWALCLPLNDYILHIAHEPALPKLWEVPLSNYTSSFVLGGLGFYAVKHQRIRVAVLAVGPFFLLAAILYGMFAVGVTWLPRYTSGTICALSVIYAFNTSIEWRSGFLMELGNRSYGIYLLHSILCSWLVGLLSPHVPNPYVMYGLLVVLSIHAGWLLGGLDLAIYRRLKNLSFGQARRRIPDGSLA